MLPEKIRRTERDITVSIIIFKNPEVSVIARDADITACMKHDCCVGNHYGKKRRLFSCRFFIRPLGEKYCQRATM